MKRLALNKEGHITYCTSDEENIGKGRCNHLLHAFDYEDEEDFVERLEGVQQRILNKDKISDQIQKNREKEILNVVEDRSGEEMDGNQEKWFIDGKFIKLDGVNSKESLSEEVVSNLLEGSNIDHVKYSVVPLSLNGLDLKSNASVCDSFLKDDEAIIEFINLFQFSERLNLFDEESIEKQYQIICDRVLQKTGLNAEEYMVKTLALDLITLNPDRHLGNLAVIQDGQNNFKFAPLYDNGLSLLSNKDYYEGSDLKSQINSVKLQTFNNTKQKDVLEFVKNKINQHPEYKLNFDLSELGGHSNNLYEVEDVEKCKNILKYNLERYEGILWESK